MMNKILVGLLLVASTSALAAAPCVVPSNDYKILEMKDFTGCTKDQNFEMQRKVLALMNAQGEVFTPDYVPRGSGYMVVDAAAIVALARSTLLQLRLELVATP